MLERFDISRFVAMPPLCSVPLALDGKAAEIILLPCQKQGQDIFSILYDQERCAVECYLVSTSDSSDPAFCSLVLDAVATHADAVMGSSQEQHASFYLMLPLKTFLSSHTIASFDGTHFYIHCPISVSPPIIQGVICVTGAHIYLLPFEAARHPVTVETTSPFALPPTKPGFLHFSMLPTATVGHADVRGLASLYVSHMCRLPIEDCNSANSALHSRIALVAFIEEAFNAHDRIAQSLGIVEGRRRTQVHVQIQGDDRDLAAETIPVVSALTAEAAASTIATPIPPAVVPAIRLHLPQD